MVWEARNLGLSKWQMTRMGGNIGTDFLLGLIPWVGAIPDYFFRSNTRNLRIIKRHLDKHFPETADHRRQAGAVSYRANIGSHTQRALTLPPRSCGSRPAFVRTGEAA